MLLFTERMTQGDDCGQTVVIEIKTLTGGIQILFSGKNEITFVVFEPGADMGSFRFLNLQFDIWMCSLKICQQSGDIILCHNRDARDG